MSLHANFEGKKNKWINQQIHKKYNKIQYASKHYGKADNSIIFKRKKPVKQRKDYKKFRSQRRRKKVHKQMAFDFDDFILKNKNENCKRIQIQPTIQYKHKSYNNGIKKIYNDYYYPQQQQEQQTKDTKNMIDGFIVNVKFFKCSKLLSSALTTIKPYGSRCRYLSQTKVHSLSKKLLKSTSAPKTYPYINCNLVSLTNKLANNALNYYKNNILKVNNIKIDNDKNWKTKNLTLDLKEVLCDNIADLWFTFDILIQYIGYNTFNVITVDVKLKVSNKIGSCNGSGIQWKSSKENQHITDYVKDIKSYIPTYIYYKTKDEGFNKIGEYNKIDWKIMTYFTNSKKKKKKKKKKKIQLKKLIVDKVYKYSLIMPLNDRDIG